MGNIFTSMRSNIMKSVLRNNLSIAHIIYVVKTNLKYIKETLYRNSMQPTKVMK